MRYDDYIAALGISRAKGDWRQAIALSERRFERHGKPDALIHLCETLLEAGDQTAFQTYLAQLERIAPENMEVIRLKALYAAISGDKDRAIVCWRRLSELRPKRIDSYINLVDLYFDQIQYINLDDCLIQFKRHFGNHPKLIEARAELARLRKSVENGENGASVTRLRANASALFKERRWEEARTAWEVVFLHAPQMREAILRICDCLNEQHHCLESFRLIQGRTEFLRPENGFTNVLRRTIRGLVAQGSNAELLLDETILACLATPELQIVFRSLVREGAAEANLTRFADHLENRAEGELLTLFARPLLDSGHTKLAWRLVMAARQAHPGLGDATFLALEAAWKLQNVEASASIALSLRESVGDILANFERYVVYATIHFFLNGADTFLRTLSGAALSGPLSPRGRIFDAADRFVRDGARDIVSLLAACADEADETIVCELKFACAVYGGANVPAGGEEATLAMAAEWLGGWREGDEARILAIAQYLLQQDRVLLLGRILAHVPRTDDGDSKLSRVRAYLATKLGDWDSAADLWAAVLAKNPSDRWGQINRLSALTRTTRRDESATVIARFIAEGARLDSAMRTDLAAAVARHGDMALAESLASQVLNETPLDKLSGRQRVVLARIFCLSGQSETAWRLYDERPVEEISADAPLAIILDPGLSISAGHHVNYNLFAWKLIESLVASGADLSPLILCRESIDLPPALNSLRVARCLKFGSYAFEEMSIADHRLREINAFFHLDLTRLPLRQEVAFVYVHSMRGLMVEGFSQWADEIFHDHSGTVVIGLIEVDHLTEGGEIIGNYSEIYRTALARLTSNKNISLLIYCETEFGRRFLAELAIPGLEVRVYPYLAASLSVSYASGQPISHGEPLRIGILGGTRREKSSHLIPSLIARTQDIAADCRWIAQLNIALLMKIMPVEDWPYISEMSSHTNAEIVDRVLGLEEYFHYLDDVEVVLLPYQERYAVSGSGVFYEAIYMGKFIVVPRDTFMPDVLRALEHPHLVLETVDEKCLEEVVRTVVRDREEIRRQLARLPGAWHRRLPSEEFRAAVKHKLPPKLWRRRQTA